MTEVSVAAETVQSVLVIDGDVVSRHAIAEYLRHCGYAVVEAANTDEAMTALAEVALGVDVILCDVEAIGAKSGFELAQWVRDHRPELAVRLAASVDGAARSAAELCQTGPHLKRPYEPETVIDYVRQLRAARDRAS